jgi:hypothetical protein
LPPQDDLDDILSALEKEGEPAKADPFKETLLDVDAFPTAVSILDDIVDYPARTYPGEETVVISTRLPVSMMGQFEEFRDKIGSRMPKAVWKTNGDLMRWFAVEGFKKLRGIQEQMDKGEVSTTPMLAAQLFLEQTGGKLVAHANVRADAKEKAARLADMLRDMMANQDYPQAANAITQWFDGARRIREVDTYWEAAMIKALIRTPDVSGIIVKLIMLGQITDEEILEQYDDLVNIAKRQTVQDLDAIPVSTDNLKDPVEEDASSSTHPNNAKRSRKPRADAP